MHVVCQQLQHIKKTNTALLNNYYLHDHCLLSKWKHVTCAETPIHASTQNDKVSTQSYQQA